MESIDRYGGPRHRHGNLKGESALSPGAQTTAVQHHMRAACRNPRGGREFHVALQFHALHRNIEGQRRLCKDALEDPHRNSRNGSRSKGPRRCNLCRAGSPITGQV